VVEVVRRKLVFYAVLAFEVKVKVVASEFRNQGLPGCFFQYLGQQYFGEV
jgi:hypothetical protein